MDWGDLEHWVLGRWNKGGCLDGGCKRGLSCVRKVQGWSCRVSSGKGM